MSAAASARTLAVGWGDAKAQELASQWARKSAVHWGVVLARAWAAGLALLWGVGSAHEMVHESDAGWGAELGEE